MSPTRPLTDLAVIVNAADNVAVLKVASAQGTALAGPDGFGD